MDEGIKNLILFILIFITAAYGISIMTIGTSYHEAFHQIMLRMFGCEATVSVVNIAVGGTLFNSKVCYLTRWQYILVAVLAPLIVFFSGYLLWWKKGAENSYIRVLALVLMLISSVPSMVPNVQGTDFFYAVKAGFNETVAWIIFLICIGLMFHCITNEVIDREMYADILRKLGILKRS